MKKIILRYTATRPEVIATVDCHEVNEECLTLYENQYTADGHSQMKSLRLGRTVERENCFMQNEEQKLVTG